MFPRKFSAPFSKATRRTAAAAALVAAICLTSANPAAAAEKGDGYGGIIAGPSLCYVTAKKPATSGSNISVGMTNSCVKGHGPGRHQNPKVGITTVILYERYSCIPRTDLCQHREITRKHSPAGAKNWGYTVRNPKGTKRYSVTATTRCLDCFYEKGTDSSSHAHL